VSRIRPDQAGEYQVVVLNAAGSVASLPAVIEVVVAAEVTLDPQPVSTTPGEDVLFSVGATSSTPITYQWRRNGVPINGATQSSLSILNVQPSDDGHYDVMLTDSVGSVTSRSARLTVLVRPEFIVNPVPQARPEGSTVILSVEVRPDATLPIGYRWRRGGATVANLVLNSHTSFLRLDNITLANGGSYSVVATNAAFFQPGVLSGRATLSVTALLPDGDGDGMPDEYENANGLNASVDDSQMDLDGDGFTNEEEFIACTDPDDANSFLKIEEIEDTGVVSIRFNAVESKTYVVQFRDNADSGAWQTLVGVPAVSVDSTATRSVSVTDTEALPTGSRFYRVVTPAIAAP